MPTPEESDRGGTASSSCRSCRCWWSTIDSNTACERCVHRVSSSYLFGVSWAPSRCCILPPWRSDDTIVLSKHGSLSCSLLMGRSSFFPIPFSNAHTRPTLHHIPIPSISRLCPDALHESSEQTQTVTAGTCRDGRPSDGGSEAGSARDNRRTSRTHP